SVGGGGAAGRWPEWGRRRRRRLGRARRIHSGGESWALSPGWLRLVRRSRRLGPRRHRGCLLETGRGPSGRYDGADWVPLARHIPAVFGRRGVGGRGGRAI